MRLDATHAKAAHAKATGCDWLRLVATGCDWLRLVVTHSKVTHATGCDTCKGGSCDWMRLDATCITL